MEDQAQDGERVAAVQEALSPSSSSRYVIQTEHRSQLCLYVVVFEASYAQPSLDVGLSLPGNSRLQPCSVGCESAAITPALTNTWVNTPHCVVARIFAET